MVLDEARLEEIRRLMHQVAIPQAGDKVYKDECTFSFATRFSPGGLYINLNTFQVIQPYGAGLGAAGDFQAC